MEIRVLKYFLLVAREENITKAANLLHLTQPTLSRQLMQLEEELGVQLFRRSKHHIVLTEEGMLLRRRAEEIVALADKTRDDLQHREEQLSGTVAVGSGELQSTSFLTQLRHLQREFRQYQRAHRARAAGCRSFAGAGGHCKIQFYPHTRPGAVGRFGQR